MQGLPAAGGLTPPFLCVGGENLSPYSRSPRGCPRFGNRGEGLQLHFSHRGKFFHARQGTRFKTGAWETFSDRGEPGRSPAGVCAAAHRCRPAPAKADPLGAALFFRVSRCIHLPFSAAAITAGRPARRCSALALSNNCFDTCILSHPPP